MPTIGKGSVLSWDVATVLTAGAEVLSIDVSGAESETFDYTTLSTSGSGREMLATGYATNPEVSAELFFLPTNAGHQALTDEILTPTTVAANQLDGQVTFADTGATTLPFKIAGVGLDIGISMDDGVKATAKFVLNGQPTWAT